MRKKEKETPTTALKEVLDELGVESMLVIGLTKADGNSVLIATKDIGRVKAVFLLNTMLMACVNGDAPLGDDDDPEDLFLDDEDDDGGPIRSFN